MTTYWTALKDWGSKFKDVQSRGVKAAQEIEQELIKFKARASDPSLKKGSSDGTHFTSTGHHYRDHIIKGLMDFQKELKMMHETGSNTLEDQVRQLKKDVIFMVESLKISDIKTKEGVETQLQRDIKKYLGICEGKLTKLKGLSRELEPV